MSLVNHRKFEISAVVASALGKFLFYDILDQRFIYILILFVFWSWYVSRRVKNSPEILREWGFRKDNFKVVLQSVLPFGLIAIVVCILLGYLNKTINPHWHIIPILIIYPIFGTLQQFLLMSLVAGNMQSQGKLSRLYIILITSFLFGFLHYPYYWLMLGTFILSLFYTHIFLKERNLYVLGLFHGWLGAIFYYTVVNKDPFIEVFRPFLD